MTRSRARLRPRGGGWDTTQGRGIAAAVLLSTLLAACAPDTPTQLLVVLSTDMDVPAELDSVRIRVSGAEGPDGDEPIAYDNVVRLGEPLAENGTWRVLASFGAIPKGGDADRTVTVRVSAVRDATTLFTTRAITSFVPGERVRLDIFIAAACVELAETCRPEETCGLEGCVDPVVPVGALVPVDQEPDRPTDPRRIASDAGVEASDGGLRFIDATATDGGVPKRGDETASSVGAGLNHACAIQEGELYCWGAILEEAGVMDCAPYLPARLSTATDWQALSSGARHSCGLRSDGRLYCWGRNEGGRLGVNDEAIRTEPAAVESDLVFDRVGSGAAHTCAVSADGGLYCWGSNQTGALGLDGEGRLVPTRVGDGATWADVKAGFGVTCALDHAGALSCWGDNAYGTVGNGELSVSVPTPTRVGDRTYRSLDLWWHHVCAIALDDSLWCWGRNGDGQLGDGTTEDRTEPVPIGDQAWRSVATGRLHTCAIRTDGALFCWGSDVPALGLGAARPSAGPNRVGADSDWVAVSAGQKQTCAQRADGSVSCWGINDFCQVGAGVPHGRYSTPELILP